MEELLETLTHSKPTERGENSVVITYNNGDIVRLGFAKYHADKKAHEIVGNNIFIYDSEKTGDAYTTETGKYKIVTEHEYTKLLSEQSAAAAATTAAAVATPPQTPPVTPPSTPPPTRKSSVVNALSKLEISDKLTKKTTIICVGPNQIAATLKQVKPLADAAKTRSSVVYVVLGAANSAEAAAALAVPTPRTLLSGQNELQNLKKAGPMKKYLKESVLLEAIGHCATSRTADQHTWVLPAHGVAPDTAAAPLTQAGDDLLAWKTQINTDFKDLLTRIDFSQAMEEPLDPNDEEIIKAYCALPRSTARPYAHTISAAPGYANIQKKFAWHKHKGSAVPFTTHQHASTSSRNETTFVVATTCPALQAALATPALPAIALNSFPDAQYDAILPLATFIKKTGAALPDIRGRLGPIVRAAKNNEPLRALFVAAKTTTATMFLPEIYVKTCLSEYNIACHPAHDTPLFSAQGFLKLDASDEVEIQFPNMESIEASEEYTHFGARLYIHGTSLGADTPTKPSKPICAASCSYLTQNDAVRQSNTYLNAGESYDENTNRFYYTNVTSCDNYAGLAVKWTLASGRPVLDTL